MSEASGGRRRKVWRLISSLMSRVYGVLRENNSIAETATAGIVGPLAISVPLKLSGGVDDEARGLPGECKARGLLGDSVDPRLTDRCLEFGKVPVHLHHPPVMLLGS